MIAGFVLGLITGFYIRLNPTALSDFVIGLLPFPIDFKPEELHMLNFILGVAAMATLAGILGLRVGLFSAIIGVGVGFFAQRIYHYFKRDEQEN